MSTPGEQSEWKCRRTIVEVEGKARDRGGGVQNVGRVGAALEERARIRRNGERVVGVATSLVGTSARIARQVLRVRVAAVAAGRRGVLDLQSAGRGGQVREVELELRARPVQAGGRATRRNDVARRSDGGRWGRRQQARDHGHANGQPRHVAAQGMHKTVSGDN